MNKPSAKALEKAFPGKGKALRLLLDSQAAVDNHPAVISWEKQCYHRPSPHERRMCALDAELETFGVEYTECGSGPNSPAIEYLNAGDTYATTILFVNGRYRIGCWGDIVERGNY